MKCMFLEEYIENGKYPNLTRHFEGNCRCKPLFRTSLRIAYDENIRKWYRLCILQKDLAKIQYRFGQINSYDELQSFLDAVLADKSLNGMTPFGVSASRGFYSLFRDDYNVELAKII